MVSLKLLGPKDHEMAVKFVDEYYSHDGLRFAAPVHEAVGQLLADPSLGRFWSIENNGIPVGYVVLTFAFDHEFGGRTGMITDIYLRDSARNTGIGTEAFQMLQAQARALGLKSIDLYVLDHNARAREFYRRNGFMAVVGRSPMSKLL